MIVDLILTPAGRERLAGGWSKLPKPARKGLAAFGAVTAGCLVLALIIGLTVAACKALSDFGFDGLAILAGVIGGCVFLGAFVGMIIYAAERD